jgi:thiamine-phosphate pyrophosphorylase
VTTQRKHTDKLKGLYAITDENLISENDFEQKIEAALLGGVRIIQYRDKSSDQTKRLHQAETVRLLCEKHQAICLINDDIDLAKTVNAHGVHLGKNDESISQARKILGENAIIGISCYNDISLAKKAENNSADYVAFGAIFSSPTKQNAKISGLEILPKAKQYLSIPVCAIGGITQDNITQVIQQHADMTAVISSIFSSMDTLKSTKELNRPFLSQAN